MTLGELAKMFNGENNMGVQLKVIPMQGYRRDMWFDETGLAWVNPSPNLRSLTQAILYPGVALSEASNVSVGRGTQTPFEVLGAPWIRSEELTAHLRDRRIPGVEFEPAAFTPDASVFKGQPCNGIRIVLKDRGSLNSVGLGIEILCALQRLYPRVFHLDAAIGLIGSRSVLRAIADGLEPESIAASWQPRLDEFRRLRASYLFYIRLYFCILMEKSHDHGQNTDRLAPKTGKEAKANNPAVRGVEVKINKTGRLIQYVYLLICKPKKNYR